MSHQDNIERIKKVNQALTNFTQEFVFVVGAVVSLYADRLAEEVRPTEDVDVVVEIYSTTDYTRMEEQLRSLGFQNDTTEMAQAEKALKEYLQEEFTGLLNNPSFEEWVDAHTGYVSPAAQAIVLPQARKFIQSE
jgi:predicted nucleotidyltransferase